MNPYRPSAARPVALAPQPRWAPRVPAAGVGGASPFQPIPAGLAPPPSQVSELGMKFLYLFTFLLLGRLCDFYLNSLRLPLVTSLFALVFALATGQMRFALTSNTAKAMFGLTLWMAIGTPFSMFQADSMDLLGEWLKSFISFIIIMAMVDTVDKSTRMLQVIALSILCAAGLTLRAGVQVANRLTLYKGLYSGPNELSTACITGLIAWVFVLSYKKLPGPLRLLLVPFALFVASLIPKTGSRSGLITIAVVLLFFLTRFSMTKRVLVLAVAVGGFFLMMAALPNEIRMRYLSLFSTTEATTKAEQWQLGAAEGSANQRRAVLMESLRVTLEYPVFGVGAGSFGLYRREVLRQAGFDTKQSVGTHNTYTQISSELGIPGFICFIASLVLCWRNVRRVIRTYKPLRDERSKTIYLTAHTLWLLLIAYMVTFCFEYIGYQPFYLVVCALITSFTHAAMKEYPAIYAASNMQRMQPA
jgi:O-antigen ligase